MANGHPETPREEGWPKQFVTTHWSVVLMAGNEESAEADRALENLCRTYWYPLYAHVRRRGHAATDAQDLTQSFFARLLERKSLNLADPARGRFRVFLLTALDHFLINEWRRASAVKRGGTQTIISWDEEAAEGRYLAEPVDGTTPELIYERHWASTLLDRVFTLLREEYVASGKSALFDSLRPQVWGDALESNAVLAARLQLSEGALRVALHRLRDRFRDRLRAEVASTVVSADEIDEELRHLIVALRT